MQPGCPFALAALVASLVVTLATVSHAADEFSFTDDFRSYRPGSDASPRWETNAFGWKARDGSFTYDGPGKDQALLAAAPHGRSVTVAATVTLDRATGKEWKVAGVCVRRDARHYWHLAFVESPDSQQKRHFVELSEMYGGRWNAHFGAGTKLTQTSSRGSDLDWKYDTPYRMTIELTPDGIAGIVADAKGTERTRIAYRFDADAVTAGAPGLVSGGFATSFSSFSTRVASPVARPDDAPSFPPYVSRSVSGVRAKATGFFRVEKIDGVWWTIDPAGNGFYIVGTDHANYNVHWCETLGYAPYHRNVAALYGSEGKWAASTVARLKSWGFNSLGTNSSRSVRHQGLPHTEFLGLGTRFARRDWITEKTTWTGFPNVFSPEFEPWCDKAARRVCRANRDDPWLLGYFIDNELEWHPWTSKGPFADTVAKPADHSAKVAFVSFMKERHPVIASFNRAWGTSLADFDALAKLTALPAAHSRKARADHEAYIRLIAERYFAVTTAAIRKHDPNHLVLGCRFAGQAPNIADIVGKYCDIVSVNFYRVVDLEKRVMADGFEEDMARWHEKTGRPMMVTEWSFPALDAGLPCKHGAGQRVPTQTERALAFTVFQKLLFATPFMVGSNFFMWADEPAQGISSTFPEDSNYGLVNVDDEPYELLTQAATRVHAHVYDIHLGRTSDLRLERGGRDGSFELTNAGGADAAYSLTLTIDGGSRGLTRFLAAGASRGINATSGRGTRPGAHVAVCRARPVNEILEKTMRLPTASHAYYVPGTPWHKRVAVNAKERVPVVIANEAERPYDRTVVVVRPAPAFASTGLVAVDASNGRVIPSQIDRLDGGREVALLVDGIPAGSARLVYLYPSSDVPAFPDAVAFSRTGTSYTVDNGALRLSRSHAGGGAAFDRITCERIDIGSFLQLIWQQAAGNFWTGPERIDDVKAISGPVRLVLDVTASGGSGARAFRTTYRFTFHPGARWFESRLVDVVNTGDASWDLRAYYHYTPSRLGGELQGDEPRGDHWTDEVNQLSYGVVAADAGINVRFWTDGNGGQHPDAKRDVRTTLRRNARYAGDEPTAYVVVAARETWDEAVARIPRREHLTVRALAPERR